MMTGINSQTGDAIDGIEHIQQSIKDILTTPIGTRVMRRDYGSRLFDLIDAPINHFTRTAIYIAVSQALRRWEPRFALKQIRVESTTAGKIILNLAGDYLTSSKISGQMTVELQ